MAPSLIRGVPWCNLKPTLELARQNLIPSESFAGHCCPPDRLPDYPPMSTLFERLDSAASELGKKVQAGVETLRLQGELFRAQNKRRTALEDLGRYAHTAARQGTEEAARRDTLLTAVDDLDAQIAKIERELTAAKGEVVSVHEKPGSE